ncbi:(Fe-S)-binding protein [Paenibacillus cisolokensis]|uniref:(Fe-S)-binding protein n=1 Tax=Paenibacillus cisolokensis TaxID=1658519 RepID=UPI003D2947AB
MDAAFWIAALRWTLFAAATVCACYLFGAAVARRIGYMRLGRPPFAGEGRSKSSAERLTPAANPGGRAGSPEVRSGDFAEDAGGNDSGTPGGGGFRDRAGGRGAVRPGALSGGHAGLRAAGDWLMQTFGHRKLLKDVRSGLMHAVMFYGFIVLQFGALDLIWKGLAGRPLPYPAYDAFTLVQEVTATAVLAAVLYAAYRRYVERLPRLKRGWKPSYVIWFIGSLMATVLLAPAFERIAEAGTGLPPAGYAPVSSALADLFATIGLGPPAAAALHELFWWLHLLVLYSFLVYIPQSKHFHLITAPVNLWLKRRTPPGRLAPLDLEDESAESFGAGEIGDFTRKQLLDLYACVECGRCTNVCPASSTGKLLSPMHLITKLRDHLNERGAAVTGKSPWVPEWLFASGRRFDSGDGAHRMAAVKPHWAELGTRGGTAIAPTMAAQLQGWTKADRQPDEVELVGGVMTPDEIWACTTCRSCEEQCPVGNEHVDKIVDLRRHLVLMQGTLPADGQRALQNIERQGNPWGLPRAERSGWMAECERRTGVAVPSVQELHRRGERPEIVLWAGSMGAYDNRSRRVLFDLVRLLDAAGVRFASLGSEERNSGDTARRLGNELLFQELARENIAILKKYGITRIVTACPHTYNTFRNEYPDFGLPSGVRVEHHTEMLANLVAEGKLKPVHPVRETVAYHDSCYLGRYNGIYDPPRAIIRSIPGIALKEMERSRERGMCCGAGGGLMWMEEKGGVRVNEARAAQALAVGPTVIGSACPYCLTMMEDGIKLLEAEETVKARDAAELLAAAVFGEPLAG